MPLTMVKPGEKVILVDVRGGSGLKHRLTTMGLSIGSKMEVIAYNHKGPVIVAVDETNTRLALGRGMAHKIIVEPLLLHGKDIIDM